MKKKTAVLLIVLMLFSAFSASAQTFLFDYSIEYDSAFQGAILLNEDGEVIVPSGTYEMIYTVDPVNGWFAACKKFDGEPHYGLVNNDGQMVTEAIYTGFSEAYADRVIAYTVDYSDPDDMPVYRYILNENGTPITDQVFALVCCDGKDGFYATMNDSEDASLYHVSHDGIVANTGFDSSMYLFNSAEPADIFPARDPKSGLAGYIDLDMNWVIEPQFVIAEVFDKGYAQVSYETQPDKMYSSYGLIDTHGKWIVPDCIYSWFGVTDRYISAARYDETGTVLSDVFDINGRLLFTFSGDVVNAGNCFIGWPSYDSPSVLMDLNGNIIALAPDSNSYMMRYDSSTNDPTKLLVSNAETGLTHFVNDDGSFSENGYCALDFFCTKDGRDLFFAETGKMLRDEQWGFLYPKRNTIRYGLIDSDGNEVLPFRYRWMCQLNGTPYIRFEDGEGLGVMKDDGTVLYYRSFYEGLLD